MIAHLAVPSHGAAPGHMPFTYKAGVPFSHLVEEADILRRDPEDFALPTAMTLWYYLSHDEDLAVRRFCRTLLWLGASPAHRACWSDLQVPACLVSWAALDLTPAGLRRAFRVVCDDDSVWVMSQHCSRSESWSEGPPMHRRRDPATSREAAAKVGRKLSTLHQQVLDALAVAGPRGLTGRELETMPQFPACAPSTIRKRASELHRMGRITDAGRRDGLTVYAMLEAA